MALRDAVLMPIVMTLWVANYRVYGVRKMWKALHRSGEVVGRDQVARLMRQLGIQGSAEARPCAPPAPTGRPTATRIWSTATSSPSVPTPCG
jgi:transposase InsO family protein